MTDIESIHPLVDRLEAYAQGRLDDPEMDEIELRLSSCDSCCQLVRDQAEDPLTAKLRGRGAAPVATDEESAAEAPLGFQVPSSFVVGPAAAAALHNQATIAGPPTDEPAPAGLPKELNDHPRYRVVAALGAGGMGTVYRAEHRLMDRPVALKVIRGDLLGNDAMVERFRREVKAAARLASHPNIVAAYDAEHAGDTHMLVMEFIEGNDLAHVVDCRGPLPVGEACEYARQAALGLQHAFEDGMVHRDIKPQNLMRTTRGQIKVLDFGLARFASEVTTRAGVTAEGMVLGSADYIAPEQIDDPHTADIRADIYSLGCTLYFLLAGRPPFANGSLIQKLLAHREKTPRPLAEVRAAVPPELARVVERMMAKDPARRFQTPDAAALALTPFADAEAARNPTRPDTIAGAEACTLKAASPSLAPTVGDGKPAQRATRPGPQLRRHWLPIAAAIALVAAGAGSLAVITYRIQTETGELVIETDDPNIDVIVTQGGKHVTIVDPKTNNRIELNTGRYELQLAGGNDGLKLSTDAFTLKRGDKTVVTVRREAPKPKPASGLLAGADTEPIREVAHFLGHDRAVYIAVVSPDGRRILSGSDDRTMILWDRETSQPIRRIRAHGGSVLSVAFAPDGRRALSGGADNVVRLWDLESGNLIRELRGHTEWVLNVAFSHDGRRAFSTSGGFNAGGWQHGTDSAVRVWDVETGQEVRKLEGLKGRVWSVAISPDGRHVLAGGHERTPILWDAATGGEVRRFLGHTDDVVCVGFLPDGRRAFSCGSDRTIRLWDVDTGQEIHCFRGHSRYVTWAALSPDGRRLLSSDFDGHDLRLWDVQGRQHVHQINLGSVFPTRGSFAPDGRHAVWGDNDGVIRMYRLPAPEQGKSDQPATPAQPAAAKP